MRTVTEILTELKDCSVKQRDYYKECAEHYDRMARENRELAQQQQQVVDDCELSLTQLRN